MANPLIAMLLIILGVLLFLAGVLSDKFYNKVRK